MAKAIARARTIGRRTRHVNARARGKEARRGLPPDLACHPQRAIPTPVHPDCNTSMPQYGTALSIERAYALHEMLDGAGLRPKNTKRSLCTYKVTRRGQTLGTVSDAAYGLAWVRALAHKGLDDAALEVR